MLVKKLSHLIICTLTTSVTSSSPQICSSTLSLSTSLPLSSMSYLLCTTPFTSNLDALSDCLGENVCCSCVTLTWSFPSSSSSSSSNLSPHFLLMQTTDSMWRG